MLENFRFPNQGVAEAFAAAQILLYKVSPTFQNYFYSIQKNVGFTPQPETPSKKTILPASLARGVQILAAAIPKQRIEVDVVVCGTWLWERRQENELLINLLKGLLKRDVSILCLLHKGSSVRQQIKAANGKVKFLDPAGVLGRLDARFGLGIARTKARQDFERARYILKQHGIYLYESALPEFEWAAARLLEWETWSARIEFKTAIVRCHWLPLCSAVAHTGWQRNRKVVTLQQGVVGHTLDIPILAHQYFCFGKSSEALLKHMEAAFFQATEQKALCQDYVRVGAIFDPILTLANFRRKTVLILDQTTRWANYLYGLEEQGAALTQLVTQLCQRGVSVIVRPHPASNDIQKWQQLTSKLERCQLSSHLSLSDDFTRSSVTVSIFSGGSIAAAASGLPSFFISTPNGYYTPDLACFEQQFLSVACLLSTIEKLCADEQYYLSVQQQCRQAAKAYYEGACTFDRLIDQILNPIVPSATDLISEP